MSAIQPHHSNVTGSSEQGFFSVEGWEETAKIVALVAAFAILPIVSYVESGALLAVTVLSLEVACYGLYKCLEVFGIFVEGLGRR